MKKQGEAFVPRLIRRCVSLVMCLLFLPTLFCVMFIGNQMDYFDDGAKADILVPNALLSIAAVAALVFCLWLIFMGKKVAMTGCVSRLTDLILVVLFVLFYFVVLWLAGEVVFELTADQGIVRETAKDFAHQIPLGYQYYFSMYYNNIPITYVLGKLYRLAENLPWFQHDPEYIWLMAGCLLTAGAGFLCCEIVKRVTRNLFAVALTFVIYLLTAGLNPWKTVPYTDSYGLFFPVLCIFLYLCSRDCQRHVWKLILLFLSVMAGMAGGLIKPSGYIVVLAILLAEGLVFVETLPERREFPREKKADFRHSLKEISSLGLPFLLTLLSFAVGYWGTGRCRAGMTAQMQLEYNTEIEATWQYYLLMGSNGDYTGSYNYEDLAVFAEFQDSKAERNAACLERAWERISERGIAGNMYFGLQKLVRSFNDGTFAWQDVQYSEAFPEDLTHDGALAELVRSFFCPGGANQAKYDTAAECVWILILVGTSGILLLQKRKSHYVVFPILLIGILAYQLLFEAGARYLYIFLPLFVVMAVCGMERMEACSENFVDTNSGMRYSVSCYCRVCPTAQTGSKRGEYNAKGLSRTTTKRERLNAHFNRGCCCGGRSFLGAGTCTSGSAE